MDLIISLLISYLFGSLLSAVIVSRLMAAPDPRRAGSKNPGVTNVLRLAGKTPALLTLLGDVLKGTIPVLIVSSIFNDPIATACGMLGAVLGHMYPVFFRFKGGKAVATSMGTFLGIGIPVFAGAVIVWLATLSIFRISSVASLSALFIAPGLAWFFNYNYPILASITLIFLLVAFRHKDNLKRLIAGTESKVRFKS